MTTVHDPTLADVLAELRGMRDDLAATREAVARIERTLAVVGHVASDRAARAEVKVEREQVRESAAAAVADMASLGWLRPQHQAAGLVRAHQKRRAG